MVSSVLKMDSLTKHGHLEKRNGRLYFAIPIFNPKSLMMSRMIQQLMLLVSSILIPWIYCSNIELIDRIISLSKDVEYLHDTVPMQYYQCLASNANASSVAMLTSRVDCAISEFFFNIYHQEYQQIYNDDSSLKTDSIIKEKPMKAIEDLPENTPYLSVFEDHILKNRLFKGHCKDCTTNQRILPIEPSLLSRKWLYPLQQLQKQSAQQDPKQAATALLDKLILPAIAQNNYYHHLLTASPSQLAQRNQEYLSIIFEDDDLPCYHLPCLAHFQQAAADDDNEVDREASSKGNHSEEHEPDVTFACPAQSHLLLWSASSSSRDGLTFTVQDRSKLDSQQTANGQVDQLFHRYSIHQSTLDPISLFIRSTSPAATSAASASSANKQQEITLQPDEYLFIPRTHQVTFHPHYTTADSSNHSVYLLCLLDSSNLHAFRTHLRSFAASSASSTAGQGNGKQQQSQSGSTVISAAHTSFYEQLLLMHSTSSTSSTTSSAASTTSSAASTTSASAAAAAAAAAATTAVESSSSGNLAEDILKMEKEPKAFSGRQLLLLSATSRADSSNNAAVDTAGEESEDTAAVPAANNNRKKDRRQARKDSKNKKDFRSWQNSMSWKAMIDQQQLPNPLSITPSLQEIGRRRMVLTWNQSFLPMESDHTAFGVKVMLCPVPVKTAATAIADAADGLVGNRLYASVTSHVQNNYQPDYMISLTAANQAANPEQQTKSSRLIIQPIASSSSSLATLGCEERIYSTTNTTSHSLSYRVTPISYRIAATATAARSTLSKAGTLSAEQPDPDNEDESVTSTDHNSGDLIVTSELITMTLHLAELLPSTSYQMKLAIYYGNAIQVFSPYTAWTQPWRTFPLTVPSSPLPIHRPSQLTALPEGAGGGGEVTAAAAATATVGDSSNHDFLLRARFLLHESLMNRLSETLTGTPYLPILSSSSSSATGMLSTTTTATGLDAVKYGGTLTTGNFGDDEAAATAAKADATASSSKSVGYPSLQVELSFSLPQDDGGEVIEGYWVYSRMIFTKMLDEKEERVMGDSEVEANTQIRKLMAQQRGGKEGEEKEEDEWQCMGIYTAQDTPAPNVKRLTIYNILPMVQYEFKIAAFNKIGNSSFSVKSNLARARVLIKRERVELDPTVSSEGGEPAVLKDVIISLPSYVFGIDHPGAYGPLTGRYQATYLPLSAASASSSTPFIMGNIHYHSTYLQLNISAQELTVIPLDKKILQAATTGQDSTAHQFPALPVWISHWSKPAFEAVTIIARPCWLPDLGNLDLTDDKKQQQQQVYRKCAGRIGMIMRTSTTSSQKKKIPLYQLALYAQSQGVLAVIIVDNDQCASNLRLYDQLCIPGSSKAHGEGFAAQDFPHIWFDIRIPVVFALRSFITTMERQLQEMEKQVLIAQQEMAIAVAEAASAVGSSSTAGKDEL